MSRTVMVEVPKHKLPLYKWEVQDATGAAHVIEAHFAFNNAAEGLIFRRYFKDGNGHSDVVASFSPTGWIRYIMLDIPEKKA